MSRRLENLQRQVEELVGGRSFMASAPEGFPYADPPGARYWRSETHYREGQRIGAMAIGLASSLNLEQQAEAFGEWQAFLDEHSRANADHPHNQMDPLPSELLDVVEYDNESDTNFEGHNNGPI